MKLFKSSIYIIFYIQHLVSAEFGHSIRFSAFTIIFYICLTVYNCLTWEAFYIVTDFGQWDL